jgi:hypothetical protein
MTVPNPYFINIELFKSDGVTRPGPNEIARINAYDVNGSVITWEGQSGYNPNTGGWYAIYMQNIAAFYPPREKPNLKFEVVNTQEQIVYTTPPFNQIASASTVKIVIGVSAEIVTGADNTVFNVSGTVIHQNGTPLATGHVTAFHVGSPDKLLGEATLASNGTYSINFLASAFRVNGSPSNPNLRVRVESSSGQLLNEGTLSNAPQNAVVNITVPDQTRCRSGVCSER